MKKVIFMFLVVSLSACTSAPKPKQPDESNRQPVNKTMPVEVQGAFHQ